jgi:hypothetical protein
MIAFIIEQNHEIREAFGYEIPFNEMTQQSMIQYARANYGADSVIRNMTNEEKVKFRFTLQDPGQMARCPVGDYTQSTMRMLVVS